MKKLTYFMSILCTLLLTGCMDNNNDDFFFRDAVVEFEDATTNSTAAGKDYPLLTAINRNAGLREYRINLLGEQLPENQALAFRIVSEESTAIEGTHFSLPEGNIVSLPANSSFAFAKINILDFPPATGTVQLVLELTGNETVKVSERYKRIGIRIALN